MSRLIYKVEVGVLLPQDHDEFDCYSEVYDEKHGYYDENVLFFLEEERAIHYANEYIKDGVVNTYGIVKELIYDAEEFYGDTYKEYEEEDIRSIKEELYLENYVDLFCSDNWNMDGIIYAKYKDEKSNIVNIF